MQGVRKTESNVQEYFVQNIMGNWNNKVKNVTKDITKDGHIHKEI